MSQLNDTPQRKPVGILAGAGAVVVLLIAFISDPSRVLRQLGLAGGAPTEAGSGAAPSDPQEDTPRTDQPSKSPSTPASTQRVIDAFRRQRSDLQVEVQAKVIRNLQDDEDGDRHQRFLIRLDGSDHTLLVAHNIDLAPRASLKEGDRVTIAGEYEFNEQGGVLHWTHHDPAGRHPDGWIRVGDRIFK